jgi:hypothetical protein
MMTKLTLPPSMLGVLLAGCTVQPQSPHVRASEQDIVNRALDVEANGKVSRDYILKSVDPVVLYLPDMTCVGLNLRRGVLGGNTTICFDNTGKKVIHHVSGD